MGFGMGIVEMLIVAAILGGVVFLVVRAVLRVTRQPTPRREGAGLNAELEAAELRLEHLERKLDRTEAQAQFVESLVERRPRRD